MLTASISLALVIRIANEGRRAVALVEVGRASVRAGVVGVALATIPASRSGAPSRHQEQ